MPLGDSLAFFYDFPKKWQSEIGFNNPKVKTDGLGDSMLARLALHPMTQSGLLFKISCFTAYLISDPNEKAYWRQVGLVTVTPDNKLIDTLTCRSTYAFNSEDITYQKFFYISDNSIIHTKTIGNSHSSEMYFFGGHDEFKILNNGVIAPFHEVDFSSEFVEKGVLGNRVLKGKTIKGLPHGPWQITELDLTLPYPSKNKHYVDYTYSIAEGKYHYGAKIGEWQYYKMKSDTLVDRNAYTYAYPTYEKSAKILKTEKYIEGVMVNQVFSFDSSDLRSLRGNSVEMPYRYTNHLYKSIVGKKYYVNYPYGVKIKGALNDGNIIKLSYGYELTVADDTYNVSEDFYYFENVLANNLKVEAKGTEGFINIKYLSPFPL